MLTSHGVGNSSCGGAVPAVFAEPISVSAWTALLDPKYDAMNVPKRKG